jgi:succinoglycan biosynthesis protein ExoL
MTHIAFFGHNSGDAAVRRRAVAFRRAGCEVTGFMPHRGPAHPTPWRTVGLGETRDNDYLQRIVSIFSGARRALAERDPLARADLFYARNLDMLALAARVRAAGRFDVPLVYECLDVHHRLTGGGSSARLLRAFERRLLGGCSLIVISSPAFEREHFARHHAGCCPTFLAENRLIEGDEFPAERPDPARRRDDGMLRIGWFGNLRCRRSFDLLAGLAAAFQDRLRIVLRGYPAPGVFGNFEELVARHPGIVYEGRYRAPQDLARIYAEVDLVWAADWYEEGANSLWLLPNRIYEGGYFATPALAPAGTETARWIEARGAGLIFDEPAGGALAALIGRLIEDRAPIWRLSERLRALPRATFVEGPETVHALVARALAGRQTPDAGKVPERAHHA